MKDLRLDAQGDLVVEENDLALVNDIEELKQRLKIALSIHKNEWFLDVDAGINYIDVLGKKNSEPELKKEMLKIINSFDEIDEVTSLESAYNGTDRKLIINFKAKTVDGEILNMQVGEVI